MAYDLAGSNGQNAQRVFDPGGQNVGRLFGRDANEWYDPLGWKKGLGLVGKKKSLDNGAPNAFGIGRNDKNYADKTNAILQQATWDEARGRLSPIMDRMSYLYQNPTGRDEIVQDASRSAEQGMQGSLRSAARSMRGLGITLNPTQQASFDSSANLASGLSRIGAKNAGSRGFDEMRQQIATGA